jgi:hypothetical protein
MRERLDQTCGNEAWCWRVTDLATAPGSSSL